MRSRHIRARRCGDLPHRSPGERLELLPRPGHANAKPAQDRRPARRANDWPGQSALGTQQLPGRILRQRGPATFAASQLPTRCASQKSRSSGSVKHARHLRRRPHHVHQTLGPQSGPWILLAPVDHIQDCPPLPLRGPVGQPLLAQRHQLRCRACAQHDTNRASSPGPLDHHWYRVPSRSLLLTQRLVVAVDHHNRSKPWTRTPRRRAGAHHHCCAGARLGPLVRQQGDAGAGPSKPPGENLSSRSRRNDHQCRTRLRHLGDDRGRIRCRRKANDNRLTQGQPGNQ